MGLMRLNSGISLVSLYTQYLFQRRQNNLSLKHSVREINYLRLVEDFTNFLNKFLVHRVFADIVISVRRAIEFDNKCVCDTILFNRDKSAKSL